jgi:dihydrofolate reductase
MRTVIARIFDYSLDGVIATEDTPLYDFCRELPDDPAQEERNRALYAGADLHVMGRVAYWANTTIEGDLIDEYRITVFPYVAGTGARLFGAVTASPGLELVSAIPFKNGTVEVSYRRTR